MDAVSYGNTCVNARITEWGAAVVKHAFRGRGIMHQLVTFIIDTAENHRHNSIEQSFRPWDIR